jgi:hypothetical protein
MLTALGEEPEDSTTQQLPRLVDLVNLKLSARFIKDG